MARLTERTEEEENGGSVDFSRGERKWVGGWVRGGSFFLLLRSASFCCSAFCCSSFEWSGHGRLFARGERYFLGSGSGAVC